MAGQRKTVTYSIGQDTYDLINKLAEQTQRYPGKVVDLAIAGMTPEKLNSIAQMLSEQRQGEELPSVPARKTRTLKAA